MVYIVGHTRKEFLIEGILLPKKAYNDDELARGRKTVLALDDAEWAKIKDTDTIAELSANGTISVLTEAPADKMSSTRDLQVALSASEAARVALQDKYNALEKEALETISGLQARVAELEKS